jgi:hypothetical protein
MQLLLLLLILLLLDRAKNILYMIIHDFSFPFNIVSIIIHNVMAIMQLITVARTMWNGFNCGCLIFGKHNYFGKFGDMHDLNFLVMT